MLLDTTDQVLASEVCAVASREAWRIEDSYSRYRDDNQIYKINNAKGATVDVDEELALLINFAHTCWLLSDGAFDITSGVLRKVWRFDGRSKIPAQADIEKVLSLVGWGRVNWDGERFSMPADMEIDLGGIGKEYAVDRVLT